MQTWSVVSMAIHIKEDWRLETGDVKKGYVLYLIRQQ